MKMKVKITQLCPTLYDPMGYSPWNSPGQNTGDKFLTPGPSLVVRTPPHYALGCYYHSLRVSLAQD